MPYGTLNPVIVSMVGFEGIGVGVGGCVISSLVIIHAFA